MNGRTKIISTSAVVTAVLAAGVMFFVRSSSNTSAALTEHELSVESHPVFNTKIDMLIGSVDKISDDVGTMMIQQGVQTETMKNMAQDIAELKDER